MFQHISNNILEVCQSASLPTPSVSPSLINTDYIESPEDHLKNYGDGDIETTEYKYEDISVPTTPISNITLSFM